MRSYLLALVLEKIAEEEQKAIENEVLQATEPQLPTIDDYLAMYKQEPSEYLLPELPESETPGEYLYPALGGFTGAGLGGLGGYLLGRGIESPWARAAVMAGLPILGGVAGALLGKYLEPEQPVAGRTPFALPSDTGEAEEYPTYEDLFGY